MSSKNKKILLATALCGIAAGVAAVEKNLESAMEKSPALASKEPVEAKKDDKITEAKNKIQQPVTVEVEKCWNIHACKGLSACDVERSDIDAANAAFNNKFAESTTYRCSGEVYGPAKDGYLGWIYVERGYCLKIENGFLIEKDKKGEKVVIKREKKDDKKDDKKDAKKDDKDK